MLKLLSRLTRSFRPAGAASALPPRPLAEKLEPRLLYSADLMPVGLGADAALPGAETRVLDSDTSTWLDRATAQQSGGELLIIDGAVDDADTLLNELRAANPALEVVQLDSSRDGIEQIGQALAGRSNLGAVHILSHGAAGELQLGNGMLDQRTLDDQADRIAEWGRALGADADILLYGCDVAGSSAGQAFVHNLAALTGADVAASTDLTGTAALGGNWVLEQQSGHIEAATLASKNWQGSLGVTAVSADLNVSGVTLGEQFAPKVAMLDNGNWMSVWSADVILFNKAIGGSIFDASGTAVRRDFAVSVSGTATSPDIASDGSSLFVVTWVSSQMGTQDIYAGLFNSAGAIIGSEFRVTEGNSTATSGDQEAPRVAMNASGDFVVTWSGKGPGDSDGVFARRFKRDGSANGDVFNINSMTDGTQDTPDVALAADGRFVITWHDGGAGSIIRARTFDANATAGSVIDVQSVIRGNASDPAVAIDASGNFAVVWAENGVDLGHSAVQLQRFDASGALQGTVSTANTFTDNDQERPRISMNASGDFVVAWESDRQDGSGETTVLRSFLAGGGSAGSEILANTYTSGDQQTPDIALNDAGQLVVVWSGERSGGSDNDISGKTFTWPEAVAANNAPVLEAGGVTYTLDQDAGAGTPVGAVGIEIPKLVSLKGSGSGPENVTDPDAGALVGIAITSADKTNGNWYWSVDDGVLWNPLGEVSATSAFGGARLLSAASGMRIAFAPNGSYSGTSSAALTFKAWDLTTGSNGGQQDIRTGTAFSVATDTLALEVLAVNRAPDTSEVTLGNIAEDSARTITAAQLLANASDTDGDTLTVGSLVLASGNGTLSSSGIDSWTFTPGADWSGAVSFEYEISDGKATTTGTASLDVTSVNDAPSLGTGAPDITVLQGNGVPAGAVGVRISTLVSFTAAGSGAQNVSDADSDAVTGIAVTAADDSRGDWWFSFDDGANWRALDLAGLPAGEARLLAADAGTRLYFNASGTAGTLTDALSFHAWDRTTGSNGGSANPTPGGGASAFSAETATVDLQIVSSNNRPTLDTARAITILTSEDAPAPLGAVGFLASGLVSFASSGIGPENVTDTDTGAQTGIAIVGINAPAGKWSYSTNGGTTWIEISASPSPDSALLLAADSLTRLYYQPTTPNDYGTVSSAISFKAWDQSSGANGASGQDTLAGNAFSAAIETADIIVQPVNDAPKLVANSLDIAEGASVTLGVANLDSSDVDESDRTKLRFSIGSLAGGYFYNTVSAAVVTDFTQDDIDKGRIEFRHGGEEVKPAYTVSVSDGSASSATQDANITFTNLNDRPALTVTGLASYSLNEDAGVPVGAVGAPVSALVSLSGSGGLENVLDPDAAGLTGIAIISADATNGSWYWSTDDGASWSLLGTVAPDNALLLAAEDGNRIAFEPNSNYNGSAPALSFEAWDRSAWATGDRPDTTAGDAFSLDSDTVTLTVRPVNDAPTVSPIALGSIAEDRSRTITAAELLAGAGDIDGDALSVENLALVSGNGTLSSSGIDSWIFTPETDWSGPVSFSFEVDDGTVQVANSASLSVTAVNDAPTFNTAGDGIATWDGGGADGARAVTVQSDGKILVAGYTYNGSDNDFLLQRYNADGTRDSSFGGGDGIVITDFGGTSDVARAVEVQSDGKIVVSGTSKGDFAVARYNGDGSADTGFGTGGLVTTDLFSGTDESYGLVIQADGKILLSGHATGAPGGTDFALVRYNANGTLDTGFGTNGIVAADFAAGGADYGYNVVVQSDGKIVMGGYGPAAGGGNDVFTVARFNANGSVDTSFGGGTGYAVADTDGPGSRDVGFGIALQADGKIVQTGFQNATRDIVVVRWDSSGMLDSTFGGVGYVSTDLGGAGFQAYGYDITVQPDGKLLVSGYHKNIGSVVLALRYNTDGSLDTGFGSGGIVTTSVDGVSDIAYSAALQSDGGIILVGTSSNGSNNDLAVIRYTSGGTLDTRFDGVNTLNGAPTYVENGAAVVLDSDVRILDPDLVGANYAGATLTLARSGGASAEDVFGNSGLLSALTESGNLVVSGTTIGMVTSNSSGTLMLTFNGNATQALVNAALQALTYANNSDSPPASVQINWTFNDGNTGAQGTGGALSATGSTTVGITAVNDAPVASNLGAAESYTEDSPLDLTDIAISDVDSATVTATLTLSVPGAGSLNTATSGAVTSTYDAGTGVWRASGAIADVNTLLAGLTFTPTADYNASFNIATSVSDGVAAPLTGSKNVTGTAVNDAPQASGSAVLAAVNEDTVSPGGATVASLFFANFSDPTDAGNPAQNQFAGVAVRGQAVDLAEGRWQYSIDGGANWSNFGFISDTKAVALRATDFLRFQPAANYNGTPNSLSVRLIDNSTTVTSGAMLNVAGFGASTPYSAAVVSAATSVIAVNDAPAGADRTVTVLEDASYTFTTADFGFSDPSDSPASALLAVKITTLPGAGALRLDGAAVSAGDFVSATDIAAGKLRFAPAANANGAGYAGFSFQVRDNGGTANGGVDLDATPNTITIDVTAVNDAPEIAINTLIIAEGATVTLDNTMLHATDVESGPAALSYSVSGLGGGFFALATAPTVAISSFTQAQVDAGNVIFTHDGNEAAPSYTLTVTDSSGTPSAPSAATISYARVNDAPMGTSRTISLLEDGRHTFVAADFGFSDPDDSPSNALLAIRISSLPSAGSLRLDGRSIAVGEFVGIAELTQGKLSFSPAANANGSAYASFGFQVRDDGGVANGGVDLDPTIRTISFDVGAVNDAPTLSGPGRQIVRSGEGFGPLVLNLGDEETEASDLSVRAYSTNQAVLPDSAIQLSGAGAERSLTVQAGYTGVPGIARIVIEVSDGSETVSMAVEVFASTVAPPEAVSAAPSEASSPASDSSADEPAGEAVAAPALAQETAPQISATPLSDAVLAGVPPAFQASSAARTPDEVGTTTIGRVEIAPIHLGTTEVLSQLYAPTEVSGAPIAESEISRSLREARLEQVFSQLRDTVNDESRSTRQEVAVAIATGTSLTIGYVAWLIRGGVLVSSLLTSMPAWRLLDPLPILGNVKSRGSDDDDSLESMVSADKATPAKPKALASEGSATSAASAQGAPR